MSSDPPKRTSTPISALFPRLHDDPKRQAVEYYDVLQRHGRILTSHTDSIVNHDQRLGKLEKADPVQTLGDIEKRFTEKLSSLEKDVIRLRTAIYVATLLIGGSVAGSTAVDQAKGQKPTIIQLTPEAIEALKDGLK